jgi:hypothetical protein
MLEYAANGHYYWSADTIKALAEKACQAQGTIDEALQALAPNANENVDQFFDRVEQNLREGQVRLVFFLDKSPLELRSVVDFLNKQMERSEVLLVEACQYQAEKSRIIVPTLFGYTEQARMVKRPVNVTPRGPRRQWDKASFIDEVRQKVGDKAVPLFEELLNGCALSGLEIKWGTGNSYGSFNVYEQTISSKALLAFNTTPTFVIVFW